MTVDWTKLIPEDPSVEMIEDLDEAIHDHFAGKATEITNQGVEAMVEFIRTETDGGEGELDAIFRREYKGEQDFYFLVPPEFRYGVGAGDAPVEFCLARTKCDSTFFIMGAYLCEGAGRPLHESEKEELMTRLCDVPFWQEDPVAWGWSRYDALYNLPSRWHPDYKTFLDRRADQRMEERMAESPPSEYAKIRAVMNAAECGDEAAADLLRELDDRGYGLIPLNESDPLSEEIRCTTSAALSEIGSVPLEFFLTKLHLQDFEVGEV